MKKIIDSCTHGLSFLIVAMLAAMVVLVFGNVVLRYGFNSGILISEEMSRWLFIWITFLGSIIAMRENTHLGSNFVVRRLPPAGRRISLFIGRLAMLYICWLVFSGALSQTLINVSVGAPITGISMGLFYASGMVFSVAGALVLVGDLYRLATGSMATVDRYIDDAGEQA
ncbi:TRAP transporter small permease, partial [Castellaniella defragrans]|jgi:TRAP-type C4-dicarboxylate transport system permease small subunit|uniref:TRAP transporter small permease protein n=1 Tax=Castellaniella defragrans (strain DSM 12143 / CCUG 39792 / 65Phen) TaxID=1437824 RepID=W8WSW2_CASD6